jgi:hypothetical protein
MKSVFASILIASLALPALPALAAPPSHKSRKPVSVKKVPPKTHRQAVEEATPTEEPDPSIKLGPDELAIAKRVYVGDIPCELGAHVVIKTMKREGFFFVSRGIYKYVMHPVESRTGAIRLEDPARGALWLQLGNKSMLMNQKEGKRIADECKSPEQDLYAKTMKPVDLLAPAPAPTAVATPVTLPVVTPVALPVTTPAGTPVVTPAGAPVGTSSTAPTPTAEAPAAAPPPRAQ